MQTSATSQLRTIRSVSLRAFDRPKVVGVDDSPPRKGWNYGAIVVDLKHRRTIDRLHDRSVET